LQAQPERERCGLVGCELKIGVGGGWRALCEVERGFQTDEAGGCNRASNWERDIWKRRLRGAGGYAGWLDGPSTPSATTGVATAWQELQLAESVIRTSHGS